MQINSSVSLYVYLNKCRISYGFCFRGRCSIAVIQTQDTKATTHQLRVFQWQTALTDAAWEGNNCKAIPVSKKKKKNRSYIANHFFFLQILLILCPSAKKSRMKNIGGRQLFCLSTTAAAVTVFLSVGFTYPVVSCHVRVER
jgi:hypothetical protein